MFGHIYKFKNPYRRQNFKLWTILENPTDMDSNYDSPVVLYYFALVYFLNCISNTWTYPHHKNKTKLKREQKAPWSFPPPPFSLLPDFFFHNYYYCAFSKPSGKKIQEGFLRSLNLRQGERGKKSYLYYPIVCTYSEFGTWLYICRSGTWI